MADERKETEPDRTRQGWLGLHLDLRRVIEVGVVEIVGVWFSASGLYELVHFNAPADTILVDLTIGMTGVILGLTLLTSSLNHQRVLYYAGALLSPLLCHHAVYLLVIKPRVTKEHLAAPGFLTYLNDNILISYFIALLVGAALALEVEIRYRRNRELLLPLNLFTGIIMGILSIMSIYIFVSMVIVWGLTGLISAVIFCVITFYALRLRAQQHATMPPHRVDTGQNEPQVRDVRRAEEVRARTTREADLEIFGRWMNQLNHEDYLLIFRTALGLFSQPVFIFGYVLARHYEQPVISTILIWSNLLMSVIIFISILAAFRVYIETRVKIRPLVQRHPDFPIRRLPDIHPGLGLYCPVGLGLAMVVIWSSLLYVEAGEDPLRQIGAIVITAFLAVAGIVSAIGVGLGLSEETEAAAQQGKLT